MGIDYYVHVENLDYLIEEVKKETVTTEEFTIIEELNLEHLADDDDRIDAARNHAKENYPEYWRCGDSADYDQMNGLTVAVIDDKKYLVYNAGTELAWRIEGEYFGTLRYGSNGSIKGWTNREPTSWGKSHVHLFKFIKETKD